MELMTSEEFDHLILEIADEEMIANDHPRLGKMRNIYAAALARIAALEAQLTAKQEHIDRLLAECAHS